MIEKYVDGFQFTDRPSKEYSYKPIPSFDFIGQTLEFTFDHSDNISIIFKDKTNLQLNNQDTYRYEILSAEDNLYLLTIHMLKEYPHRNLTLIFDLNNHLVTKIDAIITVIERDSTRIVEGTNLVTRNIDFGYIKGNNIPTIRHYFSDDLIDHGFAYFDSPNSTVYYHIHSSHKISYYQKKFPENGNPIDKDGVGYGELLMIKIRSNVYVLTFIKHSHGNQPILLWNQNNNRIVANFFGISRRLLIPFLVTGGGYTQILY